MPAVSRAQQQAIAIAEHAPGKLLARNRGLLGMKPSDMHDFASTPTRGLPQYVGKYARGGSVGKLNAAKRRALPRSDFAVPSKAPGSGSYPLPDAPHARNALARSSGKPVAAQVRAAVARKFPGMGKGYAAGGMVAQSDEDPGITALESRPDPQMGRTPTPRAKAKKVMTRSARVRAFEKTHGGDEV